MTFITTFPGGLEQSRRDQEEGGELDSQEEASPEEIKSRDVVLGYRERAGLLLLQLFPNGGATDIVFVTLFCIAVGTAIAWCCGRCAMPDGHCLNILLFRRQPWSSGLALVSRSHSSNPLSHSSPSLTGHLASVDVKQQKLTTFIQRLSLLPLNYSGTDPC